MDKRAYEFSETFSEVFMWEDIKIYIQQFWPIFYGWYSSYLTYEICFVIVGNKHDIDFLAAYEIALTIILSISSFASGVAAITRTDVLMQISKNKPITGKKYAYLGMIMKIIMSVFAGLIIVIFNKQFS